MFFSVIIFIITLLFLVVIHELGHFLVAKKFGIKVLEFGFGIPPKAWGKKVGETLVSINWLPFGGFVRLLGEDEVNKKILADKRSFPAQTVGKRIAVAIAGVVMNLIVAWILFYIVIASQGWKVIYPTPAPVAAVVEVEKGLPADLAGIKSGDVVQSIDGQLISGIDEAKTIIKKSEGKNLNLVLTDVEGSKQRTVTLAPQKQPNGEILIGVVFSPIPFRQYNTPLERTFSGISYSFDLIALTFKGLGTLITDVGTGRFGQASQQVSGPIGLAVVSNNILSAGLESIIPYLWFTGLISLTLAVMNFLPIPALDGGRLFFFYIEAILGKRIKPELESKIHAAGFAVLISLMILVAFLDIQKFFH